MSNLNVIVNDYPTIISVQNQPTQINVVNENIEIIASSQGIQGVSGPPGAGIVGNFTTGQLFIFQTPINSGISGQFIPFPSNLGNNPTIVATLQNNNLGNIFSSQISGATSTGYYIIFSDLINNTGYYVNTVASSSGITGTVTMVISNGITNISGTSYVSTNNLSLVSNNTNTGIIVSGNDINIYGNTSSNIPPPTTNFSLINNGLIYGGLGGVLGSPAGWWPIHISGTVKLIPYY